MSSDPQHQSLYHGLRKEAQQALELRDYSKSPLNERLGGSGVEVSELISTEDELDNWIPGVEFLPRRIFAQRHRGHFGELTRTSEGTLSRIGLVPSQWASALMFPDTAKGFHIHPPSIPDGVEPEAWFQRLFVDEPSEYSLRPYDKEQWDVMFFVSGNVEMFLVDERAGLPRRKMRYLIEGDDRPGANNAGVIIPAGVAHALRNEGDKSLTMVYGTSTSFNPDFEGRIVSDVETAGLDPQWETYFK